MTTRRVKIATPAYGGVVHVDYMTSILGTLRELGAVGIAADLDLRKHESHVGRARNQIASTAMREGYAALLFVDADERWRPEDAVAVVRGVVDAGIDLAGIPYATKRIAWERVRQLAIDGAGAEELERSACCAVSSQFSRADLDEQGRYRGPIFRVGGRKFGRVASLATGFLCIGAPLLARMAGAHSELRYEDAADGMHAPGVALFDSLIVNGRWLPEDWSFCERAREVRASMLALLDAEPIEHIGSHAYRGRVEVSPEAHEVTS